MKSVLFASISLVLLVAGASAQAPAPKPVSGTITAVNAGANSLTVKANTGETLDLTVAANSHLLQLPPGETDIKKEDKLKIDDLAVGEDLVVTFQTTPDNKKEVRTILVRTKSDVDALV